MVSLTSNWEAPKFTGNFLPSTRDVTDAGFNAGWTVTHLNRSFPQVWAGKSYTPADDAFGVDLILEADHYTKAERSAKYGLLFIALTFLVLIIIELRSASADTYILLSAHRPRPDTLFLNAHGSQRAYRLQSGIPDLICRDHRPADGLLLVSAEERMDGILISGLLTALYVFIFFLLAMKDYAFLVGNIGLFVILAVLMIFSAKYRIFKNNLWGLRAD